jgi:hypothetical protein
MENENSHNKLKAGEFFSIIAIRFSGENGKKKTRI